jgi:hypothetical protein
MRRRKLNAARSKHPIVIQPGEDGITAFQREGLLPPKFWMGGKLREVKRKWYRRK